MWGRHIGRSVELARADVEEAVGQPYLVRWIRIVAGVLRDVSGVGEKLLVKNVFIAGHSQHFCLFIIIETNGSKKNVEFF